MRLLSVGNNAPDAGPAHCTIPLSIAEQRKNPAGEPGEAAQVHLVVLENRNKSLGRPAPDEIMIDLRDQT